jgi:class 3 adenylate cyclase
VAGLPIWETDSDAFHHEVRREFQATVLFVDVRRSTEIGSHVTDHHGNRCNADLTMRFHEGCMAEIIRASGATCQPSADAVLATIEGPDSVRRAVAGAHAAIRFVSDSFEPDNRELLSCDGNCHVQNCFGTLPFEVRTGIDSGVITEALLSTPHGDSDQLVASSVNLAAKLSGRVKQSNSIAIMEEAYRAAGHGQLSDYRWRHRCIKLGGRKRRILVTCPTRR